MINKSINKEQAEIGKLPTDSLQSYAQQGQGMTGILSAIELSRRAQQNRSAANAVIASRNQGASVLQDLAREAEGISPAPTPPYQSQAPQGYAGGGLVRGYAGGGGVSGLGFFGGPNVMRREQDPRQALVRRLKREGHTDESIREILEGGNGSRSPVRGDERTPGMMDALESIRAGAMSASKSIVDAASESGGEVLNPFGFDFNPNRNETGLQRMERIQASREAAEQEAAALGVQDSGPLSPAGLAVRSQNVDLGLKGAPPQAPVNASITPFIEDDGYIQIGDEVGGDAEAPPSEGEFKDSDPTAAAGVSRQERYAKASALFAAAAALAKSGPESDLARLGEAGLAGSQILGQYDTSERQEAKEQAALALQTRKIESDIGIGERRATSAEKKIEQDFKMHQANLLQATQYHLEKVEELKVTRQQMTRGDAQTFVAKMTGDIARAASADRKAIHAQPAYDTEAEESKNKAIEESLREEKKSKRALIMMLKESQEE